MPRIRVIRSQTIDDALLENVRTYVAGDLQQQQPLEHLHTPDVEIGFANYANDGVDTPHFHPTVTEAQVVLSGYVELLDITNRQEIVLREGDFYVVEPNVIHVQKAIAGTRILIVKWPSTNDKTAYDIDSETQRWMDQPIASGVDK